jgi:hypothetical protein
MMLVTMQSVEATHALTIITLPFTAINWLFVIVKNFSNTVIFDIL